MEDFEDLRPYYDHEVNQALKRFVREEMFMKLARYFWPEITMDEIMEKVGRVKSAFDFQVEFMHGAIKEIVRRSSSGLTCSGFDNITPGTSYLFISNHRDIMLDSAILQTLLVDMGHQTSEITFGNNLMTPGFITEFGKLNRMFRVQREGSSKELYQISRHLSSYIRHTLRDKNVSVWIAQRNGRTKDGHDYTQTGLLKMLNISNTSTFVNGFRELRIVPMSISYEYEPCDFMKARENWLSSLHTVYKKDPDEDLKSIVAGITGFKGRIHLALGKPLDHEILLANTSENDNEKFKILAKAIDRQIYEGFRLFKTHYMAYDLLNQNREFEENYSADDVREFTGYLQNGLNYLELNTPEVMNLMLKMYANPVQQKKDLATDAGQSFLKNSGSL